MLNLSDVDPHDDQSSRFTNVERMKGRLVSFRVGKVVAEEVVVVKKANKLR